mmetsp:Transcript_94910/g.225994  ORF Transcript_94910/g.225994 Transcript_94910/m.225994 type:complete len:247 (+) Transcript_94910:3645-4385(+)
MEEGPAHGGTAEAAQVHEGLAQAGATPRSRLPGVVGPAVQGFVAPVAGIHPHGDEGGLRISCKAQGPCRLHPGLVLSRLKAFLPKLAFGHRPRCGAIDLTISTVPVAHELFAGPRPATRVVPVGEESAVLGVDLPLVFLACDRGIAGAGGGTERRLLVLRQELEVGVVRRQGFHLAVRLVRHLRRRRLESAALGVEPSEGLPGLRVQVDLPGGALPGWHKVPCKANLGLGLGTVLQSGASRAVGPG